MSIIYLYFSRRESNNKSHKPWEKIQPLGTFSSDTFKDEMLKLWFLLGYQWVKKANDKYPYLCGLSIDPQSFIKNLEKHKIRDKFL